MKHERFSILRGGTGLEARLDAISAELKRLRPIESSTIAVEQKTHGSIFRVRSRGGPGGPPGDVATKALTVSSVQDDHLVCVDSAGAVVLVARDFNHRKTPFDGRTIDYALEPYPGSPGSISVAYAYVTPLYRTATIGSYVEHQVIRPHIKPGFSVIFATKCENSGVAAAPDWIDMNTTGRAWTEIL